MRVDFAVLALSLLASAAASVIDGPRHVERIDSEPHTNEHELYKRRGGGGGGGRGGGGGGRSSSGSSSGGSRSSSGSSSSGSSSSGSGSGSSRSGGSRSSWGGSRGSSSGSSSSSSSNRGSKNSYGSGSRSSGGGSSVSRSSGPQPSFGGGRYYPGGARTPYRAGRTSPGSIVPFVLVGAALAFWPGVWLYGAYMYPYENQYRFYNHSSEEEEIRDIICGCSRFEICGCDDNTDTRFYDDLIGNGSWDQLDRSIVNVVKVNDTWTILINGTLPNDTAVEGQEESDLSDLSSSATSLRALAQGLGYWPAVAAIMGAVFIA